jgi:pimeloyl-ACP methyl ester carboxylesterase
MKSLLIPALERSLRTALTRGGFTTSMLPTTLGRMHVYDAPGRGPLPPIVLLHGLSAAATAYAPILRGLRKRARRVIALDFPGHGLSDEPTSKLTPERLFEATTALLDDVLGGEPAALVGNSLGGAVALAYAAKRPDAVRALVLLSPAGAVSSDDEWADLRVAFEVTSRRTALAFMERIYHRPPLLGRLVAHELPATLCRPAVMDLLETAQRDPSLAPEHVAALGMPILLWWGRSERLLPASHLSWWRAHLPAQAIVEEPEGVGHCPQLDVPGALTERITSFLASSHLAVA